MGVREERIREKKEKTLNDKSAMGKDFIHSPISYMCFEQDCHVLHGNGKWSLWRIVAWSNHVRIFP